MEKFSYSTFNTKFGLWPSLDCLPKYTMHVEVDADRSQLTTIAFIVYFVMQSSTVVDSGDGRQAPSDRNNDLQKSHKRFSFIVTSHRPII